MPNTIDYDVRGPGGGAARVQRMPVQPAAAFKKGDFLPWTATGLGSPPAAGSNYGAGGWSNTNRIAGRAVGPAIDPVTGLANAFMDVEVFEPGTRFPICLPVAVAPALAQISLGYELKNSALINGQSIPQVDTTQNTNLAVRVTDFIQTYQGLPEVPNWPTNVTGAQNGALVFAEPIALACAFSGARVTNS